MLALSELDRSRVAERIRLGHAGSMLAPSELDGGRLGQWILLRHDAARGRRPRGQRRRKEGYGNGGHDDRCDDERRTEWAGMPAHSRCLRALLHHVH